LPINHTLRSHNINSRQDLCRNPLFIELVVFTAKIEEFRVLYVGD
jgi:hypothetical protein